MGRIIVVEDFSVMLLPRLERGEAVRVCIEKMDERIADDLIRRAREFGFKVVRTHGHARMSWKDFNLVKRITGYGR